MNVIVCVKQIPDPETPAAVFRVDESAKRVVPAQGIAPVINPFDAQAVEAALRLKDAAGEGTVTALSFGAESARDVIKHALAMGADEGVLVTDGNWQNLDNFAVAQILAKAIEKLGLPDAIVTGRQGADWDMGVVPSGIAELLDLPVSTILRSVERQGDSLVTQRVLGDGYDTIEIPLPAVVSISNEFGDPRYPQLRQIMMAAKKTVNIWSLADIGVDGDGTQLNRLVLERLYTPQINTQVEIIDGDSPEEKAKTLAAKLREAKII